MMGISSVLSTVLDGICSRQGSDFGDRASIDYRAPLAPAACSFDWSHLALEGSAADFCSALSTHGRPASVSVGVRYAYVTIPPACPFEGGLRAGELGARPHRLVDQDAALSRPKPGFEPPWGHTFAPNQPNLGSPRMRHISYPYT